MKRMEKLRIVKENELIEVLFNFRYASKSDRL